MADLDRVSRGGGGVVAQGEGLAHQGRIDLIDHPVQAHGAVLLHPALGFEEEDLVEVERGVGAADVRAGTGPALERGLLAEATVWRVVILAFDPGPEPNGTTLRA